MKTSNKRTLSVPWCCLNTNESENHTNLTRIQYMIYRATAPPNFILRELSTYHTSTQTSRGHQIFQNYGQPNIPAQFSTVHNAAQPEKSKKKAIKANRFQVNHALSKCKYLKMSQFIKKAKPDKTEAN